MSAIDINSIHKDFLSPLLIELPSRCDLSLNQLIDAIISCRIDSVIQVSSIVLTLCNFIIGIDDVAFRWVNDVHAVFSRHNPHPIVLSRCAILYVISRLHDPTNWVDAGLLHHYVVVYSHSQNIHAVESLGLVLEQISEIVEVVHK